jgi:hypothetical protein
MSQDGGVSVDFFCAATKVLRRRYGERLCEPHQLETFRRRLAEAETAYRELPEPAKDPK